MAARAKAPLELAHPQALAARTIADALAAPSLRMIASINGRAETGVAITAVLTAGMEMFAPGRRLSGVQVTALAQRILDEYPNESLADVAVFMRQAANGELDGGEYFASVDMPRAMAWWRRYCERKAVEMELVADRSEHEVEQGMRQLIGSIPGVAEATKAFSMEAREKKRAEREIARFEKLRSHAPRMSDDELREAWGLYDRTKERAFIQAEAARRGLMGEDLKEAQLRIDAQAQPAA